MDKRCCSPATETATASSMHAKLYRKRHFIGSSRRFRFLAWQQTAKRQFGQNVRIRFPIQALVGQNVRQKVRLGYRIFSWREPPLFDLVFGGNAVPCFSNKA